MNKLWGGIIASWKLSTNNNSAFQPIFEGFTETNIYAMILANVSFYAKGLLVNYVGTFLSIFDQQSN